MNPFDVKRKALQAVKVFGKEGMAEHLKKGYGKKPAIAISIESTKVEPEGEEMEGEEGEEYGKGPMAGAKPGLASLAGADAAEELAEDKAEGGMPSEITPEILEMLLSKMRKA